MQLSERQLQHLALLWILMVCCLLQFLFQLSGHAGDQRILGPLQ
jgi:hypothetical protein